MILETYPSKKEELYNEHLQEISGASFTFRELDIIACIVHNRGEKKIASLLSISYRTVGSHVRNIMSKLGYSSREYIIDAVERSGKLQHVRQYYFHLVMEASFEKHLQKIGGVVNRSGIVCATNFSDVTEEEKKSLELFTESLTIANITLTDINLLKAEGSYEKARHNLYIISTKSVNKTDLHQKTGDAGKAPQNESKKNIAVCFDQDIDLLTIQDLEHVDFRSKSNYYFSVLELVGKLTGKPLAHGIIQEFKDEHQDLQKSWAGTGITGGEFSDNGSTHFMSKNAAILAGCAGIIIFLVYLLVWNNTPSGNNNNSNNMQVASHNQTEIWNLPKQLEHYTQRAELTKSIWDKFRENKGSKRTKKTSILTGLYGLGGVGKTSLAKNVIHNPSSAQHYDFKGWFSAETKELLQADYFELGEKHYLFTKNISDKQKILRVKSWLERRGNILLVYDNAPDMSILRPYLPDNGHIIITSRNYKLPGVIEVDVMTEKEATKLLDKLIPNKIKQDKAYDKDLKKLAKELGYLPLALSQAGAYIAENMLTIAGYLSLYNTERDRLLSDKTMPTMDKHAPAYITWDMSIKKLQQLKQEGEEALDLLDFIAYCYPENIPKKLLTQYLYKKADNETSVKLNTVLNLLRRYALIKITPHTVSIHGLVHTWLKSKHSTNKKLTFLKRSIPIIKAIYPWENKTMEDVSLIKLILPHVTVIISQMQSLTAEIEYASLLSILGDSYYTLGDYAKSRQFFDKVLTINKKHFGDNSIEIARTSHDLGKVYLKLGNYAKAKELLEKALRIKEKYYGESHIETIISLHHLGRVYLRLGKYTKAKELLEKVLLVKEKYYGTKHINVIYSLHILGKVYLCLGNYTKAKELLERALVIKKMHYGSKHVEVAYSLHHLGRTHFFQGDYEKAKKLLEKALIMKERYYGLKHVETARTLHYLGRVYSYSSNDMKAKQSLEKALAIQELHYGTDHMEAAYILYHLGKVNLRLSNYVKAKELLEKALMINQTYHGSNHNTLTINALGSMGIVYFALGEPRKGQELLGKASEMLTKLHKKESIFVANSLANIGNAYRVLNNHHESKQLLKQSLTLLRKYYNYDKITIAKVLGNIGLLYGALGKPEKKKEYLENALLIFKNHLQTEHPDIRKTIKYLNNSDNFAKRLNKNNNSKRLGYSIIVLP
ncbi:MAG: hypothetical protein COA94_08415 [Rickettsiales bacterium]|nr:MAG: hypothetical protein COA94_08415 [Rickettsiales bacterium]